MEWQRVRLHAATRVLCLLAVLVSSSSFAIEACSAGLLAHAKRIATLVRSGAGGVTEAKQAVLAEFGDVTAADLDEAIQHEVTEAEKLAQGLSNGPTPADVHKASAALAFARNNGLKIEAALMRAIKEGNADIVEGFIVMIVHGNGICEKPGYNRFCKKVDLSAGWMGENYLVEAGKTSLRAAKALIRAGAEGPLEQLVMTKFGAQASAAAIEQGTRATFQDLIPLENETAAVNLIELGLPFTIDDLILAIEKDKSEIFESALKHHPHLAAAYDSTGSFPLYETVHFDRPQMAVTLLKSYNVNVNQRLKRERNETALMPAAWTTGRATILSILLNAEADPDLSTDSGMTALLDPAQGSTVALLLDSEADPDLGLPDGWRPIHAAVYNTLFNADYLPHVRELVLAGADLSAVASRTLELDYGRLQQGYPKANVGPTFTPLAIVNEFLATCRLSEPKANAEKLRDYLVENGAK